MTTDRVVTTLVERGNKLLHQPRQQIEFTKDNQADKFLNDLDNFSHHFVLACSMDRQMDAERAWIIPYKVGQAIGGQSFDKFTFVSQDRLEKLFASKNLHRYKNKMGTIFYHNIQRIKTDYNGDASKIWADNPKSATVIRRFFHFDGFGIKIATMAANILARHFKIPMQDKTCIDISPDVQVKRVFKRLGFINDTTNNDDLIYCARELHPEYPGIFDFAAWEIGRQWCRPTNPDCDNCYLNRQCPKII